jgi:hypothetical protein
LTRSEQLEKPVPVIPVLRGWVRCALVVIAVFLTGIFTIALSLNPYRDGKVWTHGTHEQLGLPECSFLRVTGRPCPSCGMTTSFALLVRGDLWNSLRANCAGTILALCCLAVIPWGLWCALRGRLYVIHSIEWALSRLVVLFLVVMLVRWGIVLLVTW